MAALYVWILFSAVLINDDYMALYTTWRMSLGHVADIDFNVDSYTLLFNLLVPVFSLLGERFEAIYVFRLLMLLVLLGIAAQLRSLLHQFVSPEATLITILLLFLASPMYVRGLDIRPDPVILLVWLQIVLLLAEKNILAARKMCLVGVMLGIAFLLKFKSLVVLIPFVIHFLYAARRRASLSCIFCAIGSVGGGFLLALYLFGLLFGGRELGQLLRTSFELMSLSASGAIEVPSLKANILAHFFTHDIYFWLLFLGGLGIAAGRHRTYPVGVSLKLFSIFSLLVCSLVLNPHFYSYNMVTLYPLMAVFAGLSVQRIAEKWLNIVRPRIKLAAIALLIIPLVARITSFPLLNSMEHQLELHRFILNNTKPDQAVFAYEGIGLFRPSTYHWRTSLIMLERYHNGEYNVWREIVETKPVLVILSYRVPRWLLKEDRQQLLTHYTPITTNVLTLGFETDTSFSGTLLKSGFYQILNQRGQSCELDGRKVEDRSIHWLESGVHTLKSSTGCTTLRWHFNSESLERLAASESGQPPYLIAPAF